MLADPASLKAWQIWHCIYRTYGLII